MRWTYFSVFFFFSVIFHVAGLPPKIRTKQIRSSNYRKKLIDKYSQKAGTTIPASTYKGQHADHLLELQTVTSWMNNNHEDVKADNPGCLAAIKEVMNSMENLEMVDAQTNLVKGRAVQKLITGKDPKFVQGANPHVTAHIQDHRAAIMNIATKVDGVLKYHCKLKGSNMNPIETEAKKMFKL